MEIAVYGAGIMGSGIVRNLVKAGHGVRVWNRTREKAEALEADGARRALNPGEAAAGAEAIVTMMTDGDAVDAVADRPEGLFGGAARGTLWLQMSTIALDDTERLSARAAKDGLDFVDAPVLGTRKPAEEGQLVVLAGGPPERLDRAAPVFDAVGKKTIRLPRVGDGTRLKLVANTWVTGLTGVLAESLALAGRLDLDPGLFFEAIGGGPLDAPYVGVKGKMMLDGDFPPSFPLKHAAKDVRLVLDAARAAGLDLSVVPGLRQAFERAEAAGHGEEDMAALFAAY